MYRFFNDIFSRETANYNREVANKRREKLNDEIEHLYLENVKTREEKTAKENMAKEGGTPLNKKRKKLG